MERKCKSNFNHLPAVLGPWAPTGVTRSGRIVGPERANSAAGVFATVPGCGNLHSSGGRERVHSATRAPRRGPWNVPRLRAASRGALGRGCRAQWKSSTGVDPPHPPSPERTGGGRAGASRWGHLQPHTWRRLERAWLRLREFSVVKPLSRPGKSFRMRAAGFRGLSGSPSPTQLSFGARVAVYMLR